MQFRMTCLLHRISLWTTLFIWISSALAEKNEKDDACSDWKLSREGYEGFIEVNYNGEWVNLCAATSQNADEVCDNLALDFGNSPRFIERKVFDDSVKDEAISYINKCDKKEKVKTCHENVTSDCCQPAWICCLEAAAYESCSANWTETLDNPCHHTKGKKYTYSQIRAGRFIKKNYSSLSWTNSALVKLIPTDISTKNQSCKIGKDILRNCSNNCLNRMNATTVNVGSDGTCECSGKPRQSDTECYNELKIIDNRTDPGTMEHGGPILCIAATMRRGRVKFSAEDCEEFLQPLCLKEIMPTTIFSPTKAQMSGDVASSIVIPTLAVLGVLLCLVGVAICSYKCSKNSDTRDPFHNNSMCNRTYDRQMPKHDEEYAIISEIELDSGTTIYKPSLPERGNDSSGNTYHTIEHGRDVSNAAIITLDEYSTPSDMITDKDKADPADEYMTTYDDPIRHNLQNTAECKCKGETIDANETLSKELESIGDKCVRDSQKGDNETSKSYEYIVDIKKETNVDEKILNTVEEKGKETQNDNAIELNESHTLECNLSAPVQSSVEAKGDTFEHFNLPVLDGHRTLENTDYEETNIIDGNFPSRPKDVFEEHVCLHCLKPEHLKRLGIKIIPDKSLDDVERRLSEPHRRSTYSVSETDSQLRRCLTDVSRKDRHKDLIDFEEYSDIDKNVKECSVCNNVYDCMGRIRKRADTKTGDNEYDHLSNWKQISEKKTLMENS